jgi:hypothetical protein
MDTYAAWKTSISAAFLILDLTSAIKPLPPGPQPASTLQPDPLPCLLLIPTTSTQLSETEQRALALLIAKKREWDAARQAEEAMEKRKGERALGWMFLTMEGMLAQDVLVWCSRKRGSDGAARKAELRDLTARIVWEKLAEKMDAERQR